MIRFLTRTLLKGLTVVLPVAAALYILIWIIGDLEVLVRNLLQRWLPEGLYFPGMGILLLIATVFLVGLLMYPWLTRQLFSVIDRLFRRIPLFSSIYSPVKDLMDMFGGGMQDKLGQVVMVKVPNTEMETLGFITQDSPDDMPEGFIKEDHVVVFVQWSSQLGGYCFIVPRESVREVDMSVEDGLRWALTAGLSAPKSGNAKTKQVR